MFASQSSHLIDESSPAKVGRDSHSRSTSPGSSSDGKLSVDYASDSKGLPDYEYPATLSGSLLPKYEYPSHLTVKNTFLDAGAVHTLSLAEFLEDRRIQSAPVALLAPPPGLEHLADPAEVQEEFSGRDGGMEELGFSSLMSTASEAFVDAADCCLIDERGEDSMSATPWGSGISQDASSGGPGRLPLVLSALIDKEEQRSLVAPSQVGVQLGSFCPTVGSQGHWMGLCKPCAFFHTKGCGNGESCPFCHLCDAGEKKRRLKEKKTFMKAARQMAAQYH